MALRPAEAGHRVPQALDGLFIEGERHLDHTRAISPYPTILKQAGAGSGRAGGAMRGAARQLALWACLPKSASGLSAVAAPAALPAVAGVLRPGKPAGSLASRSAAAPAALDRAAPGHAGGRGSASRSAAAPAAAEPGELPALRSTRPAVARAGIGPQRAPFPRPAPEVPGRLPTGLARLDAFLGGGLPRGQITEISGGPSSGKATLALAASLRAIAAGTAAAWVDAGTGFWPLAALEAGAPADRLLVVRTPDDAAACRAADILLGASGAVDLVVVDLAGRLAFAEGRVARLHRLAERGGAALIVLNDRPADSASLSALVALRLCVRRRDGEGGARLEVAVTRHKLGPDGRTFLEPVHDPDRLRLDSTI